MEFVDCHGKSPSMAATPTDMDTGTLNACQYIVISSSRNSVTVLNEAGEVVTASPMDRSAFKDISGTVELLGPNPTVETVDCISIGDEILDHYERWYSEIKKDGSKQEDIVNLLKEMMIYANRNHPMVMASPVAGPEVLDQIFHNVLDRIANAHDD